MTLEWEVLQSALEGLPEALTSTLLRRVLVRVAFLDAENDRIILRNFSEKCR
jgi:hypothetical protein